MVGVVLPSIFLLKLVSKLRLLIGFSYYILFTSFTISPLQYNIFIVLVASSSGRVSLRPRIDNNGVITIDAEVIGGQPAANNVVWTAQNPDGSFSTFHPGSGPASVVVGLSGVLLLIIVSLLVSKYYL